MAPTKLIASIALHVIQLVLLRNGVECSIFLDKCNNSQCIIKQDNEPLHQAPFECHVQIYDESNIDYRVPARTSGPVPSNASRFDIKETYVKRNRPHVCESNFTAYINLPNDDSWVFLRGYKLTIIMVNQPYTNAKDHILITISTHNITDISKYRNMQIVLPCFELSPEDTEFYANLTTYPQDINSPPDSGKRMRKKAAPLKLDPMDSDKCIERLPSNLPLESTSTEKSIEAANPGIGAIYIAVAALCFSALVTAAIVSITVALKKNTTVQYGLPSNGDENEECPSIYTNRSSIIATQLSIPQEKGHHHHPHTNTSASVACTQCDLSCDQRTCLSKPYMEPWYEADPGMDMGAVEKKWYVDTNETHDSGQFSTDSSSAIEC